jgi:hypothetical protein
MKTGILFSIAGAIMGSAGISLTDWQLYAVLIVMAVATSIERSA